MSAGQQAAAEFLYGVLCMGAAPLVCAHPTWPALPVRSACTHILQQVAPGITFLLAYAALCSGTRAPHRAMPHPDLNRGRTVCRVHSGDVHRRRDRRLDPLAMLTQRRPILAHHQRRAARHGHRHRRRGDELARAAAAVDRGHQRARHLRPLHPESPRAAPLAAPRAEEHDAGPTGRRRRTRAEPVRARSRCFYYFAFVLRTCRAPSSSAG